MTKQNKSHQEPNEAEFEDQINELEQAEIEDQEKENKEDSELNFVEELQKEKNNFLRLFAEFENYKKRTSKERIELYSTANRELMTSLLPILDDFERGLKELEKSEDDALFQGMQLIYNKFKNTLTVKGLKEVEVKMGDTFDAEIHEAISQVPAPSEDLKGKIYDVVEKGYKLGETIIRFPKVVTCL
jgi:molecular chaperone GrpE